MIFTIIIEKKDLETPNGTRIIGENLELVKDNISIIFQKDALVEFIKDIRDLKYHSEDFIGILAPGDLLT